MSPLIEPYCGQLKELYVATSPALLAEAHRLPSWDLTPRQSCDLELLMSGALSPLDGFMGQADYRSVAGLERPQHFDFAAYRPIQCNDSPGTSSRALACCSACSGDGRAAFGRSGLGMAGAPPHLLHARQIQPPEGD